MLRLALGFLALTSGENTNPVEEQFSPDLYNDSAPLDGQELELFNGTVPVAPGSAINPENSFYNSESKPMLPLVHDSILYLVSQDFSAFSLSAIDYSTPHAPRLVAFEANAMSELPFKMVADGNVLAISDANGVYFYDIFDPSKISLLSAIKLRGISDLVMADGIALAYSQDKVTQINAKNPERPFIVENEKLSELAQLETKEPRLLVQATTKFYAAEEKDQATRRQAAPALLTPRPTKFPTRAPNTRYPTKRPTTRRPTARPTTRRPTLRPTTR